MFGAVMLTLGQLFLFALFVLTIAHLISLKLCSNRLDHRTAPLFIGGWTLIGLAASYPMFGGLLGAGLLAFAAHPWLGALVIAKGCLLYVLLVGSQDLMKVSLSSRHYVTPLAVGLLAICNWALGEQLGAGQWFSALGLCLLAGAFLLRGHAADLGQQGRRVYARLVVLVVATGVLDHFVLSHVDWYSYLLLSNIVLLALAVGLNARNLPLLRDAALHPLALFAGVIYAATELLKFYQQVSINPVTAVVLTQAMTKPVILVLSALIWHERTLREQLIWGLLAFAVALPMFFGS